MLALRTEEVLVSHGEDLATDDEIGSICDDGHSEISTNANGAARGDVHPISYGTNWTPQPNFSMFKETQRNMKPFHAGNDIQVTGKRLEKPFSIYHV